ncbi:sodium:proton exchanger [bacterium]|nr:sodium:proton exchanger [bacterium]
MTTLPFLGDLVLISSVSAGVALLLGRLKIPTIAGFLCAGALLGPHGFALETNTEFIERLADIGVVLLLFTIGLEFSIARLRDVFKQAAVGGLAQILLTLLVAVGIGHFIGIPLSQAVFYGFLFALSSTAVVLRVLSERGEVDAPHGRFILGTLIFQDLCVIPMVLIIPLLNGQQSVFDSSISLSLALLKAAAVIVGTFLFARVIVPTFFSWVDAARSREIFLLAVLCLCLGTAWLTSQIGLSVALGAFLAGMIVADSEYGHRAMGDILPLRDVFLSLFFVSLGMFFNGKLVIEKPLTIALLLSGFLFLKGLLATLSAMLMKFPARAAWLAGVGLAQFGEFGFVLTQVGLSAGIVSEHDVQPVLTAGVISICLTPLLLKAAPHMTAGEKILAPLERLLGIRGIDSINTRRHPLENHVVVIGFGVAGRQCARELAERQLPFVAIDMNASNVRLGRSMNLPVYYGDASSPEALRHTHLKTAKLVLVMINDPQAVLRIIDAARRVAPNVPLLVRTHYVADRDRLLKLGASDVIVEEIEAAHAMVARMLAMMTST